MISNPADRFRFAEGADIDLTPQERNVYPRTNYEMTQADLDAILDACKPVPYSRYEGGCPTCKGVRFRKCASCGQPATRLVRTNFQYRLYWVAVDDATFYDIGDPIGRGKTEHEAIDDLREQIEER